MVRFLIIALLLFSACTKGQVIGVYNGADPVAPVIPTPPDFSVLINNGTFSPSTTLTSYVNQYQNYQKGWLINLNMNPFLGSYVNAVGAGINPPDPAMFNIKNLDVARWADSAVAHDIDYVVITIINEWGFKLWRSKTPYNMATIKLGNGYLSPYYNDYSVTDGADTSIVSKIVTEFRSRGIEPVPYINSVTDFNVLHGNIPHASITTARQNEYINYMCRLMQEMIITFGFKYIWIDYAANLPAGLSQAYYNAIKSADPTCQVIGNALGETNFSRYPYDIASTEEHAIYSGSIGYRTTSKAYGGTTYYVGQEIVATPYGNMSQWYYYDSLVRYLPTVNPFTGNPPWTNLTETSASTFQNLLVNPSKTYQKPFLAAVIVDRNGVLYEPNLTYLRNLNFIR